MLQQNKIHIFTDADLDGSISYLTVCWYFQKKINVTVTTKNNFREDFTKFLEKNNLDNYSRIYVLDMFVGEHADILDRENVTIIDHHPESISSASNFVKARTLFKEEGSACKLIYTKFKEVFKKDLDSFQKSLISIGHDYDSYTLKHKELSIGLNTLFWNFQGNRLEKFTDKYYNGFKGFSQDDKRIISFYTNKIDKFIEETQIYTTELNISKRQVKVVSVFADFCINEIAQRIIDITSSEICIIVNPKTERVNFRRAKNSDIDVSRLAEKLAGGGGHESAAGGLITENFLLFTKTLKTVEKNL